MRTMETFSNVKDMRRCLAEEPNYKHSLEVHACILKVVIVAWRGVRSGARGSMPLVSNCFAIQGARKSKEIVEISRAACG